MFRETAFESLTGDLEYNPRLAVIYCVLAAAALSFWVFAPPEAKFTIKFLVLGDGGLALLLKGIFFFRRTSDGIGNSTASLGISSTQAELNNPPPPEKTKTFPTVPLLTAQIIQDVGSGCVLVWPVSAILRRVNESWKYLDTASLFLSGLGLFGIGWLIRRLFSEERITLETN